MTQRTEMTPRQKQRLFWVIVGLAFAIILVAVALPITKSGKSRRVTGGDQASTTAATPTHFKTIPLPLSRAEADTLEVTPAGSDTLRWRDSLELHWLPLDTSEVYTERGSMRDGSTETSTCQGTVCAGGFSQMPRSLSFESKKPQRFLWWYSICPTECKDP